MEKTKILDAIVPNYTEKFLSGQYSLDEMPINASSWSEI
jgi:hypothetical protein